MWKPEVDISCLLSLFSTSVFEVAYFTEPGPHYLGRLAGHWALWVLLSPLSYTESAGKLSFFPACIWSLHACRTSPFYQHNHLPRSYLNFGCRFLESIHSDNEKIILALKKKILEQLEKEICVWSALNRKTASVVLTPFNKCRLKISLPHDPLISPIYPFGKF